MKVERDIIKIFLKGKSRYYLIEVFNFIFKEEMFIFFFVYQSYIWNRILSFILFYYVDLLKFVKGKIMDYLIYIIFLIKFLNSLKNFQILIVLLKIFYVSDIVNNVILEILNERGVKFFDFDIKKIKSWYFKLFLRFVIVFLEKFEVLSFEEDDFYEGYYKLRIKFYFFVGFFVIMLIKSLIVLD